VIGCRPGDGNLLCCSSTPQAAATTSIDPFHRRCEETEMTSTLQQTQENAVWVSRKFALESGFASFADAFLSAEPVRTSAGLFCGCLHGLALFECVF
jgi:hypothetical protein